LRFTLYIVIQDQVIDYIPKRSLGQTKSLFIILSLWLRSLIEYNSELRLAGKPA